MRYRLLILAAFLVTGCTTTPAPTLAVIHTPQQLPAQIPSDGLLYLPLESTGTPEANPTLLVEAVIIDAVTHQPVPADVYIVNAREYRAPLAAEQVLHGTKHFEIRLLAQLDGWFVVRAPGYEDWSLRLHYHLKTSRKLSGPIQLQRRLGDDQITTLMAFDLT